MSKRSARSKKNNYPSTIKLIKKFNISYGEGSGKNPPEFVA